MLGQQCRRFDGYAGPPTTKSEEQKKRATTRMSAGINVAEGNKASVCQADFFLGNSYNKQWLIKITIERMQSVRIIVKQAIGDSDTMIVLPHCNVRLVLRKLWS